MPGDLMSRLCAIPFTADVPGAGGPMSLGADSGRLTVRDGAAAWEVDLAPQDAPHRAHHARWLRRGVAGTLAGLGLGVTALALTLPARCPRRPRDRGRLRRPRAHRGDPAGRAHAERRDGDARRRDDALRWAGRHPLTAPDDRGTPPPDDPPPGTPPAGDPAFARPSGADGPFGAVPDRLPRAGWSRPSPAPASRPPSAARAASPAASPTTVPARRAARSRRAPRGADPCVRAGRAPGARPAGPPVGSPGRAAHRGRPVVEVRRPQRPVARPLRARRSRRPGGLPRGARRAARPGRGRRQGAPARPARRRLRAALGAGPAGSPARGSRRRRGRLVPHPRDAGVPAALRRARR